MARRKTPAPAPAPAIELDALGNPVGAEVERDGISYDRWGNPKGDYTRRADGLLIDPLGNPVDPADEVA